MNLLPRLLQVGSKCRLITVCFDKQSNIQTDTVGLGASAPAATCGKNRFVVNVAVGCAIKYSTGPIDPSVIRKDCKQMPKRVPFFIISGSVWRRFLMYSHVGPKNFSLKRMIRILFRGVFVCILAFCFPAASHQSDELRVIHPV